MKKRKCQLAHACAGIILTLSIACGSLSEMAGPADEIEIVEVQVKTPAGTEYTQVLVPAGAFLMGWTDGPQCEGPVHEVELDAFYIDKYEVTLAQYLPFMDATGDEGTPFVQDGAYNQPNQPVVGVFWHQARNYCEWAGGQLPTEAQWEKAAGGTDGRFFPWGSEAPDVTRAHFDFSAGTLPIGRHPNGASPYGAHDMAGNVWEWTLDEYCPTFYARSSKKNPVNLESSGVEDGPDRTLRGGGWFSSAIDLRVSGRFPLPTLEEQAGGPYADVFASIGFRCVRKK